jgi:hypothetical protein
VETQYSSAPPPEPVEYKRKGITIGVLPGAGANYQVPIRLYYTSGSGFNAVSLDGDCKTNFGDVRFVKDDFTTHLYYHFDQITEGSHADVMIKMTDDLEEPREIYIYYGNPLKTSIQSGIATYVLFDDFKRRTVNPSDDNRWLVSKTDLSGVVEVGNSYLTISSLSPSSDPSYGYTIVSTIEQGIVLNNKALRWKMAVDTTDYPVSEVATLTNSSNFSKEKAYKVRIAIDAMNDTSDGNSNNQVTLHKYALQLGLSDENLLGVGETAGVAILGYPYENIYDFGIYDQSGYTVEINSEADNYPGMVRVLNISGGEDIGAGATGGLAMMSSRGGYTKWDWLAVRNYIGREAEIVNVQPVGDILETDIADPEWANPEVDVSNVENAGATRFYIPVNISTMRDLVEVDPGQDTAYINMNVLKDIFVACINRELGTSEELSPNDISINNLEIPVSFTTLVDDIRNILHEESLNTIIDNYTQNIFGVPAEDGGNVQVLMKSFIKNLSSLENRLNSVFLGDSADEAISGDISLNLDTQNNLYKRFENDDELSGTEIKALPGYVISVSIGIDGNANIFLNYSSDESAEDPSYGPIVLPTNLRGIYAGQTQNFFKYTNEVLTSDSYPVGKTAYLADTTGMVSDGGAGIVVNVALVSCGGDRGYTIPPPLVATDLLLHFDAEDINSYPGTGSTWVNIGTGGSAYNATITGPTFNVGPPSSFTFVRNYLNSDTAYLSYDRMILANPPGIADSFTYCAWIKTSDVGYGQNHYQLMYILSTETGGVNNDWGFGIDNNGKLAYGDGITGGSDITIRTSASVNTGSWVFVSVTRNQADGSVSLYINGALDTTGTCNAGNTLDSGVDILVGSEKDYPGYTMGGEIGLILGNATVLSSGEILQNYNATKARYGY